MATEPLDPAAEALFGRTRRRVLSLLYAQPDRSFYLREISRHAATGLGAVQRELARLERAGLVIRRVVPPQVHFSANTASPVFRELQSLLAKIGGYKTLIQSELEKFRRSRLIEFAFIYGSVAQGRMAPSSDVDLLIIGQITLRRLLPTLRKLEERTGREVNPSVYGQVEFARKYSSRDHFVRRIMEKPKIMLVGTESDLRELVRESLAR